MGLAMNGRGLSAGTACAPAHARACFVLQMIEHHHKLGQHLCLLHSMRFCNCDRTLEQRLFAWGITAAMLESCATIGTAAQSAQQQGLALFGKPCRARTECLCSPIFAQESS